MESFIDAHIHVQPWKMMKPSVIELMRRDRKDMELVEKIMNSPKALLEYMDRQKILRVALINYVSPKIMGFTEQVNEFITDYCKADPKRLISFGSILATERTGQEKRIDELFGKLGLRGIKIHPPHQTIFANDYLNGNESLRYLYQRCEQEGIPVMFHTGTSIFQGARNRYADPIYIDDVAIDFPKLKIILAHGGRPLWMETAMFLVRRFPNVSMDISSIPPSKILEYFPRLEDLADKVLFGSDWPAPMVKGMRENFEIFLKLPLSDAAKEKIGRLNAEKIFSL